MGRLAGWAATGEGGAGRPTTSNATANWQAGCWVGGWAGGGLPGEWVGWRVGVTTSNATANWQAGCWVGGWAGGGLPGEWVGWRVGVTTGGASAKGTGLFFCTPASRARLKAPGAFYKSFGGFWPLHNREADCAGGAPYGPECEKKYTCGRVTCHGYVPLCVCVCPSRAHGLGSGCNATGMCVRGVCVCVCVCVCVGCLCAACRWPRPGARQVDLQSGCPHGKGRPAGGGGDPAEAATDAQARLGLSPRVPKGWSPAATRGYLLGLSSVLRSINRSIEAVPGLLLRSDRLGQCNAQGPPPSAFPRVPKGWSPAATRGARSGGCFLRVFSIDHGEPRVSPRIVYI